MNVVTASIFFLFLLGYSIGAIPFSFLIGRLCGVDIRRAGSGNVGATNVWRVCGRGAGITAYFLDIGKGGVAALVNSHLIQTWGLIESNASFLVFFSFFTPIFGHVFSVFLKFKGGKGVAVSAGVLSVITPIPLLGAVICFFSIFIASRKVAIASISAAAVLPLLIYLQFRYGQDLGALGFQTSTQLHFHSLFLGFAIVLALSIIVLHHSNICLWFEKKRNREEAN